LISVEAQACTMRVTGHDGVTGPFRIAAVETPIGCEVLRV
jgi:hypothetical protein